MHRIPYLPILTIDPARLDQMNATLQASQGARAGEIIGIRMDARPTGDISIHALRYHQHTLLRYENVSELGDHRVSVSRLSMDNLNSAVWKSRITQGLDLIYDTAFGDKEHWALYLREGIFLYPKSMHDANEVRCTDQRLLASQTCFIGWEKGSAHAQIVEMAALEPLMTWIAKEILHLNAAASVDLKEAPDVR